MKRKIRYSFSVQEVLDLCFNELKRRGNILPDSCVSSCTKDGVSVEMTIDEDKQEEITEDKKKSKAS